MDFIYIILQPGIIIKTYMTSTDLSEYLNKLTNNGLTFVHIIEANVFFVGTDKWVLNMLALDDFNFMKGETHES